MENQELLTISLLDSHASAAIQFSTLIIYLDKPKNTCGCQICGSIQSSQPQPQPQPMSEKALARAQQIAFKVTSRLGGRGIFGVEMFVKGDDVWFSEVSPRPHDTGLVTLGSQRQSEFALHARAILGLPVTTALTQPAASAVIYGGMAARGIAFDGLDAALRVPDAQVRLFGKPEAFVRRRMGVAVVPAKDIETYLS